MSADVLSHRSLADSCRPREHDQRRPVSAWARLGYTVIEERAQGLLLSAAKPAEPLHRGDLKTLENSVPLSDADCGDRGEELGDTHGAGR